MIVVDVSRATDKDIAAAIGAYAALPRHIANKHLKAAMGRSLKPNAGVLRKNTPPIGVRRGRRKAGEKPKSTGNLRRSVAVKTKAKNLVVSGVLGYRASFESRKAIWLEFGTSAGIDPRGMMATTKKEIDPKVRAKLINELRAALAKAVKELSAGRNPGNPRG